MTLRLKHPNGDIQIYHENRQFSSDGKSYTRGDMDKIIKEYGGKSGYNIIIR